MSATQHPTSQHPADQSETDRAPRDTAPAPGAPAPAPAPTAVPQQSATARRLGLPTRAGTRRMAALARAELTLLLRNRTMLFSALVMPALMIFFFYSVSDLMGMEDSSLSVTALLGTGGIGMVLLMVVYSGLVASYVARREERVLKRLRTGEVTDGEIFMGTAFPSVFLALLQVVVLVGVGATLPSLAFPSRPDVLLLGVALGVVLMTLLAIVTASFTRTVESAQITALPVFMVAMVTSGMMIPLDTLPDRAVSVFEMLPFTPMMDLIRAGWIGETDGDLFRTVVVGVAWTVLAAYGARRWFRWDPRS